METNAKLNFKDLPLADTSLHPISNNRRIQLLPKDWDEELFQKIMTSERLPDE